jgi:membrane-bound lytic murein transglycosylase F
MMLPGQHPSHIGPDASTLVQIEKRVEKQIEQNQLLSAKSGNTLHLLIPASDATPHLPHEKSMIEGFLRANNLSAEWTPYSDLAELGAALDGLGDYVVLGLDYSKQHLLSNDLEFTIPWGVTSQQVIIRSDTASMNGINDLTTRQIALKKSSPAWQTITTLASDYPSMAYVVIAEDESVSDSLSRLSRGYYDLVILDSMLAQTQLDAFLDLEVSFNLTDDITKAWAVSTNKPGLHASLNRYLNDLHLSQDISEVYFEDLPDLKQKKRLRLITFQDATHYFINKGKLQGFEYELLKRFAGSNGLRLDVVIAESFDQMTHLLETGKGDVIAGSIPLSILQGSQNQFAYTNPYSYSMPLIVGRQHDYPLLDIRDLDGRRIVLAPESPYYKMLEAIQSKGINLEIVQLDEGNLHDTLFQVSQGNYDLTVIGSNQRNTDFTKHINLKVHFNLGEPAGNSWAVSHENSQLVSALNDYISREYRKAFYNVVYTRHVADPSRRRIDSVEVAGVGTLSPYDELVYEHANKYGFDWRLVLAQMYTESQFNPQAVSVMGATGLMQLMPATASAYGTIDLNDPASNVDVGGWLHTMRVTIE